MLPYQMTWQIYVLEMIFECWTRYLRINLLVLSFWKQYLSSFPTIFPLFSTIPLTIILSLVAAPSNTSTIVVTHPSTFLHNSTSPSLFSLFSSFCFPSCNHNQTISKNYSWIFHSFQTTHHGFLQVESCFLDLGKKEGHGGEFIGGWQHLWR